MLPENTQSSRPPPTSGSEEMTKRSRDEFGGVDTTSSACPAPVGAFRMKCSSDKEILIREHIRAYYHQLTVGCRTPDCTYSKCASSGPRFEFSHLLSKNQSKAELMSVAVDLTRQGFQQSKDSSCSYYFCEGYGHPTYCCALDALDEVDILACKNNDEMLLLLQRGLASDVHTMIYCFPLRTQTQYADECALLQDLLETSGSRVDPTLLPELDLGSDVPSSSVPSVTSSEQNKAHKFRLNLDLSSVHAALRHACQVVTNRETLRTILQTAVSNLCAYITQKNAPEASGWVQNYLVCYNLPRNLSKTQLATRCILVLLQIEALFEPTYGNSQLLHQLCEIIQRSPEIHPILIYRLACLPASIFRELVVSVQQYISVQLYTNSIFINETIASATSVLSLLYQANYAHRYTSQGKIGYEEFYNGAVNDIIDVRKDFIMYVKTLGHQAQSGSQHHKSASTFTFAQHPFMLDLNYKSLLLHFHSRVEQEQEVQNTLHAMMAAHLLSGTNTSNVPNLTRDDFCFKLVVDRQNLVKSTMDELSNKADRSAYKKPLRVHFTGEDGVDEGGLRKEFFQLLIKEIFDPKFGMFQVLAPGTIQWFMPDVLCSQRVYEFQLVGLLFGLAIYNSVILDVQFPLVVFKKLLGHDAHLTMSDLADVDASLAYGLQKLLDFEENPSTNSTVENTFCRSFCVEYVAEQSGTKQPILVDLKENGQNIPLTVHNREEYVQLYIQHYLVGCCKENFTRFRNAFLEVCNNPILRQIRPAELEQLVVGSPILDFTLLRNVCKYDGYKKTDRIILDFWDIVLTEMSQEQQRKFLKFCTGSDRVPVGGLGFMNFVIGKNGGDSDLLPTAHTCFNHLLLPEYETRDRLKSKLMMAISNCQGFGLM